MVRVVHTFIKGIRSKANVTARLWFKLAYFETAVQHDGYYATGTLCVGVLNVYVHICACIIYVCMYVYLSNPSPRAGSDTKSIFKQSTHDFFFLDWSPYQD